MKRLQGWLLLLVILTAASLAPVVWAGVPTGASPSDPLMVTGAWQTLTPKARLWFYFDYSGDKSRIQVLLDDNGASDVDLSVFTPQQAQAWIGDPTMVPIGRGTLPGSNTEVATHNLVWQGQFNAPGRYQVAVSNNNLLPISFRLTILGENVALGPTPTPTPGLMLVNPFATPVSQGTIQGRVLFQDASGGNIYEVNGDGSNLQRVTYGLDPALSPDGKRIAFTRWNAPAGVFIANRDGSNEQQILNANKPLSPQWSPDGTKIAFTRLYGGGTQDDQTKCFRPDLCFTFMADPHFKIGVLEPGKVVDDVVKTQLTEPVCSNHCFSPTWSRDNYTLAYADAQFGILATDARTDLVQKDLEGKILRPHPRLLFNQNPNVQSTRYSPDGSQIVFQVKGSHGWNISVMNADGSHVVPVTREDPLGFSFSDSVAPTWSPDGKEILFLSDRNGPWEFYAAKMDGSNLRQVLKNVSDAIPIRYNFSNERVMDWSP